MISSISAQNKHVRQNLARHVKDRVEVSNEISAIESTLTACSRTENYGADVRNFLRGSRKATP